jgi:hypothetical protein
MSPHSPADDDRLEEFTLDPEVLRRRREITLTTLALGLILGCAAFAALRFFHTPPPSDRELALMAERAVRAEVGGSGALEFPPHEEGSIKQAGEQKYEVSSHVRAYRPDGASELFAFDCVVEPNQRGVWQVTRLSVRAGY